MDANELSDFLQTAASEMGFEEQRSIEEGYAEPEVLKRYKKFIKNGGNKHYFGECRADEIYSDQDFIQDLLGDRIYGAPNREEILDHFESEFPKAVKALRGR